MVKRPSVLRRRPWPRPSRGDEQPDISSPGGRVVDIRKLEKYAQDDLDAYSYSGGLCLPTRALLEFVEMFQAPIRCCIRC